jgi:hypothetical protein
VALTVVVTVASPFAANCTSIFKDFALTAIGIVVHKEMNMTWNVLIGLSMSFFGGVAVMTIKHREAAEAEIKIKTN